MSSKDSEWPYAQLSAVSDGRRVSVEGSCETLPLLPPFPFGGRVSVNSLIAVQVQRDDQHTPLLLTFFIQPQPPSIFPIFPSAPHPHHYGLLRSRRQIRVVRPKDNNNTQDGARSSRTAAGDITYPFDGACFRSCDESPEDGQQERNAAGDAE